MLTDWYNEMIALYGSSITNYLWAYTDLDFGESAGVLPVQWIANYDASEPSTLTSCGSFPMLTTCPVSAHVTVISMTAQ